MLCPYCGNEETQVKDSRSSEDGSSIKRRRHCTKCDSRFNTFERVQIRELSIIKSDGTRRPFDRDKLARSIEIAVGKRPVSKSQIEIILNNIVKKIELSNDDDISTKEIGKNVMEALSELDQVAYVRFASVYKEFRETKDFEKFIKKIK